MKDFFAFVGAIVVAGGLIGSGYWLGTKYKGAILRVPCAYKMNERSADPSMLSLEAIVVEGEDESLVLKYGKNQYLLEHDKKDSLLLVPYKIQRQQD